ncbi:hypothetical protein RR46_02674 [Papilio xuthus]|uniref:Uncharacterized protein n=1 Tax=Papilio xuthus TaxID=66420 RepID=A0A194QA27_PAPXU|nr:hypothetical protein RR46_02674 [Papilio xuthus]
MIKQFLCYSIGDRKTSSSYLGLVFFGGYDVRSPRKRVVSPQVMLIRENAMKNQQKYSVLSTKPHQALNVNPLKCNSDTVDPKCVVEESAVFSKWYAYDANGQECILIRWSDECDSPGNNVNIYASIKECQDECDRELKARRFG